MKKTIRNMATVVAMCSAWTAFGLCANSFAAVTFDARMNRKNKKEVARMTTYEVISLVVNALELIATIGCFAIALL